jgi:hypothetical protein
MAEHGAGPTGQDRGELRRVRQGTWPDEIDATVQVVELTALHGPLDLPPRNPTGPQLSERHDGVLPTGDRPDSCACRIETTHVVV